MNQNLKNALQGSGQEAHSIELRVSQGIKINRVVGNNLMRYYQNNTTTYIFRYLCCYRTKYEDEMKGWVTD